MKLVRWASPTNRPLLFCAVGAKAQPAVLGQLHKKSVDLNGAVATLRDNL